MRFWLTRRKYHSDNLSCLLESESVAFMSSSSALVQRPVVAIGNFDGAHRGHGAIADRGSALAHAAQTQAIALTFEPHPRQFFRPDPPMFRLTIAQDKLERLKAIGFDEVVTLPFDAALAAMSAEDFVRLILVERLKAGGVVVGEDFHFGKGRAGTPDFLRDAGARHGFAVHFVAPYRDEDGTIISSSAIRAALENGEIEHANRLLGYEYAISGEVLHGRKLGRDLGYPTANIALEAGNGLKHGIYACRLSVDGITYPAIASFGVRPHFDNGAPLLEVHVFDFSSDLYGKTVRVEFIAYLRGEEKFASLDALIQQMNADSAKARAILGAPKA